MNKTTRILVNIAIIIGILALCLVVFNNVLGSYYKMELLMEPCALCDELKGINKGDVVLNISNLTVVDLSTFGNNQMKVEPIP